MKVKYRWDENLGFLAGIVVVLIIGKLWLVPDMGSWKIIEMLIGW